MARRRPTPSMVISLIALFVALGGSSYAAVTINSSNVKNNSLTGTDIKNNSVASADIRNGSLLRRDFKSSELASLRGATGPQGAAGPTGPTGPQGPKGETGTVDTSQFYTKSQSDGRYLRGTITVVDRTTGVADAAFANARADCPAGYQAVGGGVDPDNVLQDRVTGSAPVINNLTRLASGSMTVGQHGAATGWVGWVVNEGAGGTVTVAAICSPIG